MINQLRMATVIISLILSACATTHPGHVMKADTEDVVVSGTIHQGLSDNYYLFVEYTIENKTGAWKDVRFVSAEFNSGESEILVDEKLTAWIEGAELKLKKAQYNTALILGSIAAVGAVASASSSNSSTNVTGAVIAGTALAGAAAVDVSQAQQRANSGVKGVNGTVHVPKTHIFTPTKIAPESYVRRWVVIQNPVEQGHAKGYSIPKLKGIIR